MIEEEFVRGAFRQYLKSIPDRIGTQYYIGTFDGTNVTYVDKWGVRRSVPMQAVQAASVLRKDTPNTLICIKNGRVYAVSALVAV